MADTYTSSSEQSAFDAWSKLFESTMKNYTAQETTAKQTHESKNDPWVNLIDQLWTSNPYSKLLPMDPGEITRAFQQVWLDALSNPGRFWANYSNFVQEYTQLMTATALKFWGIEKEVEPVAAPEKGHNRCNALDWKQKPVFDVLNQGYLLTATTLLKTASEIQGLDEKQQRKMVFYLRQFI